MAAQDAIVTSVVTTIDANSASSVVTFNDGTSQTVAPVTSTTPAVVTLTSGQTVEVKAA